MAGNLEFQTIYGRVSKIHLINQSLKHLKSRLLLRLLASSRSARGRSVVACGWLSHTNNERVAILALSIDLIVERVQATARGLTRNFGIDNPRIALAGLNPHAGESGKMGQEEEELFVPAVERLLADGCDVTGPLPADTMFHEEARVGYDAAVCAYHDQALVPLKTLYFDDAVNITLGLPIVRTSPDHGTAFDIAGQGIARPDAMIAAIRMAGEIAARRSGGAGRR